MYLDECRSRALLVSAFTPVLALPSLGAVIALESIESLCVNFYEHWCYFTLGCIFRRNRKLMHVDIEAN